MNFTKDCSIQYQIVIYKCIHTQIHTCTHIYRLPQEQLTVSDIETIQERK